MARYKQVDTLQRCGGLHHHAALLGERGERREPELRTPERVYRLARALGVSLAASDDGHLIADGPRGALTHLTSALTRHKTALLAGACSLCADELATHGDRCKWCDVVRGRRYTYDPGSVAERAFLALISARLEQGHGSAKLR